MYCMNCGLELPEEAKFCKKCAASLTSCGNCGEQLPGNAKFCWKCGTAQETASSGLNEGLGSHLSSESADPENILPQRPDNAMRYNPLGSARPGAGMHNDPSVPSPFKPLGSAKKETAAHTPAPAPRGAANVRAFRTSSSDLRPEAPQASASAGARAFKPQENKAPAQAPGGARNNVTNNAAATPSPFKPLGSAKKESAPQAASAPRAFRPGSQAASRAESPKAPAGTNAFKAQEKKEPEKAPAKEANNASNNAANPSPFKPLGTAKRESTRQGVVNPRSFKPSADAVAAEKEAAKPSVPSGPFKPLGAAEPKKEAPKPVVPSGPFKPLGYVEPPKSAEPEKQDEPVEEEPKPSIFSAFKAVTAEELKNSAAKGRAGSGFNKKESSEEPDNGSAAKPANPSSMFNMGSSGSGSLSSLGSSESGSLSSLGSSDSESLSSPGSDGSDDKLPQRTENPGRFFPKAPVKSEAGASKKTDLNPFSQVQSEKKDDVPSWGLQGASPFKPLKQ